MAKYVKRRQPGRLTAGQKKPRTSPRKPWSQPKVRPRNVLTGDLGFLYANPADQPKSILTDAHKDEITDALLRSFAEVRRRYRAARKP